MLIQIALSEIFQFGFVWSGINETKITSSGQIWFSSCNRDYKKQTVRKHFAARMYTFLPAGDTYIELVQEGSSFKLN